MKKLLMIAALSSAALSTSAADVGIINVEKVAEQSVYLKQQASAFQQRIQGQRSQLDTLGKELQGLQQRMQSNAKMTDAEKQKIITSYQTKMGEFEKQQQDLQGLVQANNQTVYSTFGARLKQAADQLRQENKLDVILNKNSVISYDAASDLTDKMIQKINSIK
jgi:outer membrane protein